jgi:hypothetical protein
MSQCETLRQRTYGTGKDAIHVTSEGTPGEAYILWALMILLHKGEHNIPECYWHQRPAGLPPARRPLRPAA